MPLFRVSSPSTYWARRFSSAAAFFVGSLPVCAMATPEATNAGAASRAVQLQHVARVELHGAEGVSTDILLSLLPRSTPADYTEDEFREYQRRLNNLGLFDQVAVGLEGNVLVVRLRKKFTLTPALDLSTGRTLADTYLKLGADQYNAFGRAADLGGYASYSERAPNAEVWYFEHAYDPHRLAPFVGLLYYTSSLRFDHSDAGWYRRREGGYAGFNLPYGYGSALRFQIGVTVYNESYFDVEGPISPSRGVYVSEWIQAMWDKYTFRDLAPSGFRVTLYAQPGALVGPAEVRHKAQFRYLQGIPLSETTVIMIQGIGDVATSGNPNWSALVGSVSGVRGLSDAYYRNNVQGVANVEFRQAWRFADRWALQGVLFADGAVFRSMDERGRPGDWTRALSTGVGARLIPTFLAGLVLRVDSAWLHTPESTWLLQTGLNQYF